MHRDPQVEAALAGGVQWKEALIQAGAKDVLAGTALEDMGENLGFWCLQMENVVNDGRVFKEQAQVAFGRCAQALVPGPRMQNHGNSKTFSAAPRPCCCFDNYPGATEHNLYVWDPSPLMSYDPQYPELDDFRVKAAPESLQWVVENAVGHLLLV